MLAHREEIFSFKQYKNKVNMERMLSCSVMRMIAARDQTNGHCKQDNVYHAIQRFHKPLRRDILVSVQLHLVG